MAISNPQQNSNASFNSVEQKTPLSFFVVLTASIAAIAGVLFGFDTGVISGAILFIKTEFHLTPLMNGAVVSAVLFGALLGSMISGYFADYFGRRMLLIITALIFVVGTLLSATAPSVLILMLSRGVVGFAIGIASFTTPLYISEIAPPRFRGALVSLNQLAITIGILVSYGVDTYFAEAQNWRWMLGVGVVPAVILFCGMFFLPRSPRWMVLKGNKEAARKVLSDIRGIKDVSAELDEIQDSIQEKPNWRMLFRHWLMPALVIGVGLAFFQQCTGINTIIYYAPTIFQLAGFHSATIAILATAGVGVVNVLFTILALFLIDSWGRRPLLLIGLTGMCVSLVILSISFYVGGDSELLKWLALGSMVIYIACFAMSLGPIMWLVISEIFPLEVRGIGSSLAVSACWGFNLIVAVSFLTLINALGPSGTFLIFAVFSIAAIVFVHRLVPETKGVSLEHIETNLRAGIPSRDLGQWIDPQSK
jgi:sugar porter (SP) family MFS transporter